MEMEFPWRYSAKPKNYESVRIQITARFTKLDRQKDMITVLFSSECSEAG